MNTCVALVGAYLRFNGYVTVPEQPVLIGEGKPYRYHTATDVDILAVRFPNAAVVVPRAFGAVDDDLLLAVDPVLDLHKDAVDVLIGEVKSGRPRLNEGLRQADVLYATLRRVDPGFDQALEDTIQRLIREGEAECHASGKRWRFRLVAFGEGQPAPEGGPYMVVQLRQVAAFLMATMRQHHEVWKDAQFGDSVLDLMHLFDKMGFEWALVNRDDQGNPPTTGPNKQPQELKNEQNQNGAARKQPPELKKTHNQNGSPKKQPKKKTRKPDSEEQDAEQQPAKRRTLKNRIAEQQIVPELDKRTPPVSMKHAGSRQKRERD